MASFSSSSKKTKLFFCVQQKTTEERDKTEKEKSPNCLMYHTITREGLKKKKDTILHTEEGLVFFFWKK